MMRNSILSTRLVAHLCAVFSVGLSSACGDTVTSPAPGRGADVTQRVPLLSANPIQYGYDAAGRLIAVSDPNGNAAQYIYDAAGNILSVTQYAAGTLAIFDVSPVTGGAGMLVTITGSGFSTTPANNTVKFNGTSAAVSSATAQQLVVTVPSGATAGDISVTVGGTTQTSTQTFTVGSTGPNITSLSPTVGNYNTLITVTGTGFQTNVVDNAVSIGGEFVQIIAATASQLSAQLAAATSGKMTVTTPYGTTISAQDYFVVPSGVSAGAVGFTGRVVVDGNSLPVIVSSSAQVGLVLFDANANDVIDFAMTGVNTGGSGYGSFQINNPDGSELTTTLANSNQAVVLPTLPAAGTYMIVVTAQYGATQCDANIILSRTVTGTLAVNGPSTIFSARPGQQGIYTFQPTSNGNLTGVFYNWTFSGDFVGVYISDPNKAVVQSYGLTGPEQIDLTGLGTGTYTIQLEPFYAATGKVSLQLVDGFTGTVTVDGNTLPVTISSATQMGFVVFDANVNETIGLTVTSVNTGGSGAGQIQVTNPDGSQLALFNVTGNANVALPTLPATGTYAIVMTPEGGASEFNANIAVFDVVEGPLAVNGGAVTFSPTLPGEEGFYSFTASAGESLTLSFNNSTFSTGNLQVSVIDPNGHLVITISVPYSTYLTYDLTNLGSGSYTVVLSPATGATGNVTLRLASDATGSTGVENGSATTLNQNAYQNGRYTFSANANDNVTFLVTSFATTPANANVVFDLLDPNNNLLKSCNLGGPSSCPFGSLPATGTYTVTVEAQTAASVSLSVLLFTPIEGTLPINGGAVTFSASEPGQQGIYTFTPSAGDNLTLSFGSSISSWHVPVSIIDPNGNVVASLDVWSWTYVTSDLTNLGTGSYTVVISPAAGTTGSVVLRLIRDATGSAGVENGSATTLNQNAYQNGRYTFFANANDSIALGILSYATTPSNPNVLFTLLDPNNNSLRACDFGGVGSCQFGTLPVTGTYTLTVEAHNADSLSVQVLLSTPIEGAVAVNGSSVTFSTSRYGQQGIYTFTPSAGANLTLGFNTSIFQNSLLGSVLDSHGHVLMNLSIPYDTYITYDLTNLAATTYTVVLSPVGSQFGSVSVHLASDATASLTENGSAVTLNQNYYQNGRYTFSATAGDFVGLGVPSFTVNPSYVITTFQLFDPSGSMLATENFEVASNWSLGWLPSSGTYSIAVDTQDQATISMQVVLPKAVTGTLPAGVGKVQYTADVVGRPGVYSLTVTAGENYSIQLQSCGVLATGQLYDSNHHAYGPSISCTSTGGGSSTNQLYSSMPAGTYSFVVIPSGTSTGNVWVHGAKS